MKQKLFTLLTLLLAVCSGAWATVYATYAVSLESANDVTATNTDNFFTLNTGGGFNTKYTGTYGGKTYTAGLKINSSSSITFTTAVKSDITIVQSTASNGTNKFKLGGQSVAHTASGATITIGGTDVSYTMTENSTDKVKVFVFTDVPATNGLAITNDKETGLLYVKVELTEQNTNPTFNVSVPDNKLTLKSAPAPFTPTATGTFQLSGENLTAGTYNFTIPSVSGTLSVSPTQITIPEGGTLSSTTFTVSYTGPGTDVAATDVNITATIDEQVVTIPVNYRAMASLTSQTTVSGDIEWDWAKVSGSDRSSISSATVYANYDEFTFGEGFDASALVVKSSPNMLSNGAFRLGEISFTTSVAGTVTVTFANTSSSNKNRYITVKNDNTTQTGTVEADGTTKRTESFEVVAGEVTLGSDNSYLQLYKIEFVADNGKTDLTSFAFSGGTTTVTTETTDDFVAPTLTAMAGEDNVTSTIASNVTYASNNTDVATVDASTGVVTLTGTAGTATITATLAGNDTYKDNTASYTITVEEVAATGITAVTSKTWTFGASEWSGISSTKIVDNMEVITNTSITRSSAAAKTFDDGSSYSYYLNTKSNGIPQLHIKVVPYSKISVYTANGNGRTTTVKVGEKSESGDVLVSETGGNNNPKIVSCAYTEEEDGDIYIYNSSSSTGLYIYAVKVEPLPSVTLNTSGYGTFSYGSDVEIVGADAYTATLDVDNAKITCTKIADGKVPAGAGVLLYGEASAKAYLCPASSVAALSNNNLKGTTNASGETVEKGSNTYYVLSGDTFVTYNGDAFSANKAYFEVSSGTVLARNFSIVFEDESTGISASLMNSEKVNSEVYNLNGQRVMNPTKGLYIVNGRKVVIK
ncbi:MAG: hypothetical protein IJ144_05000 [Prevotella sp.]|nr:hypothetical protein [Prevotella sp.]